MHKKCWVTRIAEVSKVNVSSYITQLKALYTLLPREADLQLDLNFSGKHPAMLQLMHKIYSRHKYPPVSTTRYSFIQLSELEQYRVNKLAQGLTLQHRIRAQVFLVERPKHHCAANIEK